MLLIPSQAIVKGILCKRVLLNNDRFIAIYPWNSIVLCCFESCDTKKHFINDTRLTSCKKEFKCTEMSDGLGYGSRVLNMLQMKTMKVIETSKVELQYSLLPNKSKF